MFNIHTRKLYPNQLSNIEELDKLIWKIGQNRLPIVDPKNEDNSIMPKVVWKYKTYIEIAKHRIFDFVVSACEEWNRGNVGAAFVLTRCIYENEAYIYDIYLQLKESLEKRDFKAACDLINNRMFGVKIPSVGLPIIPNVLTMIDKLDKALKGYRSHYDHLSELTHPNHLAMAGLYCQFNREPYTHSQINSAFATTEQNLKILIESIIPSLMMIDLFLKNLDDLYSELAKLSDEDYASQKNQ